MTTWWHQSPHPLWRWSVRAFDPKVPSHYPLEVGLHNATGQCVMDDEQFTWRACRAFGVSPVPSSRFDRPTLCLNESLYPHFEFVPKRAPYTLADVALRLNKTVVSIGFLGDSTMLERYETEMCALARTPRVTVQSRKLRRIRFTGRGPRGNLPYTQHTHFVVDNRVHVYFVMLRLQESPPEVFTPAFYALCRRFDVLAWNLGLWYQGEQMREPDARYTTDMTALVNALSACATGVLAYFSHNVQHFPTPMGYFSHDNGPAANFTACPRVLGPSVETVDVRTRWLRDSVLRRSAFALVPPPWVDAGASACSTATPEGKRPMYYVPFADLSFDELSDFHFMRRRKTHDAVVVDCTHLFLHVAMSAPVSDALFWAVFNHQRRAANQSLLSLLSSSSSPPSSSSSCELPPPPAFSTDVLEANTAAVYANYDKLVMYMYQSRPGHDGVESVYLALLQDWDDELARLSFTT